MSEIAEQAGRPEPTFDIREVSGRRPGARSWLLLLETEWKLILRDSAGMIIPLGLPLLIMVMNGIGAASQRLPGTGGMTVMDGFVLPLVLVMVLATISVINVPTNLAVYRKEGILRRLGVTPASPGMVLVAHLVVNLVQTLIGVALAVTVAILAFDASLPRSLAAIGVFALTCAAMYAIGTLLAAVAPSTNFALATGLVTFFGMMAVGGGFGSRESLPHWIATVGSYSPFGAGMDTLGAAWVGAGADPGQLLALGITTVLAAGLALRLFRWT